MSTTASPNMNLPVPVVGDEAGPQYAIDINTCMNQIDAHNHTSGSGVQITPSGLNINADLPFSSNNLTGIRSARFTAQGAPLALAADLGCLYVSGVDLYYNDENGNQVRITQSGGVAGTSGSIAGLVAPASATYVALSNTFVWQSAASTAAIMDFRSAIYRNSSASSFGLTLQAPSLGSDYTLTLPTIPGSNSFMTLSSAGVMGAGISQSQGILTSMIADLNVTTAKINDLAVTTGKINDLAVTTGKINTGAVTPVKLSAINALTTSSCGSFTTGSTSAVDVTNLVTTITTTADRPVFVALVAASGSSAGSIAVTDATNPAVGSLMVRRDSTDVSLQQVSTNVVGSSLTVLPSLYFIDFVSSGTYVYKIRAKVTSGTTVLSVSNLSLYVYQL